MSIHSAIDAEEAGSNAEDGDQSEAGVGRHPCPLTRRHILSNTCFLTAAVQCLSHSLPLQHYLLCNAFVHELSRVPMTLCTTCALTEGCQNRRQRSFCSRACTRT